MTITYSIFGVTLSIQAVKDCEIYPSATLQDKSPAQHANLRLRGHLTFALLKDKFLGEKSGLAAKTQP